MTKLIEIIVSPDGQTRVETKGFHGAECRQASRAIEQALGAVTAERLTAEYHRATTGRSIPLNEGRTGSS